MTVSVAHLDWTDIEGSCASNEALKGPFDVILAADVIYGGRGGNGLAWMWPIVAIDCTTSGVHSSVLSGLL